MRSTAFLICLFAQASATAADLASRIDAVTVYPAGATVTRIATADLQAGANEIRLTGLVRSIDINRLRVEVGNAGVRIGQIRLGEEQQRDAYDAEVAATIAAITDLDARMQTIEDGSNAARLRLKFLDGIAQGYASEAGHDASRGAADVNAWRAALDLLQTGAVDANQMIRANDAQRQELAKDMSLLQRKLGDLRGGSLATAVVELTLNADRAISTDILLRYYQPDAQWSPLYEARLDSDNGSLQLAQQARIYQVTDEDWQSVALTLSTSEPEGELAAPRLDSEFLDLGDPGVVYEMAASDMMAKAPAQAEDALEAVMVTGARNARIGNFAVNYETPGRSSVPNDIDEAVTVDLARFDFDVALITQVVPRQSTEAYLAARFIYDEALPLSGGSMAVFVDGVYAGNTEMPAALPQAELVLPMGQDRRVEVRAQTQGGEGGRSGIVNKRKVEVTDYIFEIVNRRNSASDVEVLDRIPVARNSDIDVEVPRSATTPDERDIEDRPGLVLWRKSLQAGETWRIRHQYTVSYPADSSLVSQ